MATYQTKEILQELIAALQSNTDLDSVALVPVVKLEQELNQAALYVSLEGEILSIERQRIDVSGYTRTLMLPLTVNVDSDADPYKIYDVVNSVEATILNDGPIWDKIIDRNIVTIEYDNAEFYPKRTAVILLEIKYKMACEA